MFDRKLSQDRLLVGIGGNMGSGKSTVASELKRYGAKIIDADEMGWSILAKGTDEYRRLIKVFGRGILTKTGNIDRRALGKLAFAGKANLNKLNAIVHPTLLDRVRKEIDRNRKGLVVVDAALLFTRDEEPDRGGWSDSYTVRQRPDGADVDPRWELPLAPGSEWPLRGRTPVATLCFEQHGRVSYVTRESLERALASVLRR